MSKCDCPVRAARAIAFGFLEAPLKGKLLLPTADFGDSVPLLQDVKENKPENTAGNYKCRPRKFQMRLPCTGGPFRLPRRGLLATMEVVGVWPSW